MRWTGPWKPGFADALAEEAGHKQQMSDAGVDPANPAEREAWELATEAETARVLGILRDVRDRYARSGALGRLGDRAFRTLENRISPLVPGEPVMFEDGQRWLNGTFGGPVADQQDPQRPGSHWVTATASGQRVPVFLGDVRRKS